MLIHAKHAGIAQASVDGSGCSSDSVWSPRPSRIWISIRAAPTPSNAGTCSRSENQGFSQSARVRPKWRSNSTGSSTIVTSLATVFATVCAGSVLTAEFKSVKPKPSTNTANSAT